jgi:hypothetical protein
VWPRNTLEVWASSDPGATGETGVRERPVCLLALYHNGRGRQTVAAGRSTLTGDGFLTAWPGRRTRPVCSQSLNGKRAKILVSPPRLSVDVLNNDTGGLLGSRIRRQTNAVKFPHEAEANNNSRTESNKQNRTLLITRRSKARIRWR